MTEQNDSSKFKYQYATFEERTTGTLNNICERLEELESKVDSLRTEHLPSIRTDIALLKLQAGLWGAGLGAIAAGLVAFFKH